MSTKHHGVLFKAEMIRALLAGTKTQTRRLLNPQPTADLLTRYPGAYIDRYNKGRNWNFWLPDGRMINGIQGDRKDSCQWRTPYEAGELIYAKETFFNNNPMEVEVSKLTLGHDIVYRADGEFCDHFPEDYEEGKWTSSLFLTKKLSRIWREVVEVRCQRVNEITEADAIAEGIEKVTVPKWQDFVGWKNYLYDDKPGMNTVAFMNPILSYKSLWNTINTAPGTTWEANPWVWVYEFQKTERPQI